MSATRTPRVSILIPNFNNGRASSKNGEDDLILNLLRSLDQTLRDDPTPFEVIVYDDGSTDDSLNTLRQWAKKKWRDGSRFLTLIEDKHCGVLARTANIMSRRAKGEYLARLDGDVVCLTPQWVSKLCAMFDAAPPRLGMIGPKQLTPGGKIHAYGDFILHPHGYTHVAAGMPRDAVKHRLEVDHVMGCFYCCRKAVFDDIGGYDEDFLRGQTIDFGLRARLNGWSAIAVPDIEYIHNHVKRQDRSTEADTDAGVKKTLDTFERKWGFSRLAPDMDYIRRRYAGTPLLWNKFLFGDQQAAPADAVPVDVRQSNWARYASDKAFQAKVNLRVILTGDIIRQTRMPKLAVVMGSGDGLVTHLLAKAGLRCIGFDDRPTHVDFARRTVMSQTYPVDKPRFEHMSDIRKINLPEAAADFVLIDSMLERHPNPVAIFDEVWRICEPQTFIALVSQRRNMEGIDPSIPEHFKATMTDQRRYVWIELVNQVQAVGGWRLATDIRKDDPSRDMAMIVQRVDRPARALADTVRLARVA